MGHAHTTGRRHATRGDYRGAMGRPPRGDLRGRTAGFSPGWGVELLPDAPPDFVSRYVPFKMANSINWRFFRSSSPSGYRTGARSQTQNVNVTHVYTLLLLLLTAPQRAAENSPIGSDHVVCDGCHVVIKIAAPFHDFAKRTAACTFCDVCIQNMHRKSSLNVPTCTCTFRSKALQFSVHVTINCKTMKWALSITRKYMYIFLSCA